MTNYPSYLCVQAKFLLILLSLLSTSLFAAPNLFATNPASQEFVNEQISITETKLQAEINAIPKGSTGATGVTGATGIADVYTEGTAINITGATISGAYVGGTGITISGDTISQTPSYSLGDCVNGGIVFYLDATEQHGLIVQLNQASQIVFNSDDFTLNATSNGIGAGLLNTAAWIGHQDDNTTFENALNNTVAFSVQGDGITSCPAATSTSLTTCNGQWYVPSVFEMRLLFSKESSIAGKMCGNNPLAPLASLSQTTCANNVSGSCYWTSNSIPSTTNTVYGVNNASDAPVEIDRNGNSPQYYRAIRQF